MPFSTEMARAIATARANNGPEHTVIRPEMITDHLPDVGYAEQVQIVNDQLAGMLILGFIEKPKVINQRGHTQSRLTHAGREWLARYARAQETDPE